MLRNMLQAKIHRATVTDAELEYEGSITIDAALLEAAGLLPHQVVRVWDLHNGERFETYVLPGERRSGIVCVNGAAARKVQRGDQVIIAAFSWMEEDVARQWVPRIVMVDAHNRLLPTAA